MASTPHAHSPSLSRRGLVAGLAFAAAPAASALAVPVAPEPDTELLMLGRAWQTAARRYRDALDRESACGDATDYPEPPEALFRQPGDFGLGLTRHANQTAARSSGRGRWWYVGAACAQGALRSKGPTYRYEPTPAARARAEEIVAAYDRWQADCTEAEEASGYTAAEEAAGLARRDADGLANRVAAATATTLAGLAVKARVAGEEYVFDGEPNEALVKGLVGDILALVGEPLRLPAPTDAEA